MKKPPSKVRRPSKNPSFEEEREQYHRAILTSVSHDLKTPLACIIGALEIYERSKEKLSSEKKEILLQTALEESYRLDSFISNILDMAKLEQGLIKPLKKSYDMQMVIQNCLVQLSYRLRNCDVQIKKPKDPIIIMADHLLLSRALCILLDNAAKYCSVPSIIELEYKKTEALVSIQVRDRGPGIPTSKLEEIFSKYSRVSKQDFERAGTGLGLPICREIMQLLGGTVTVKNRPSPEKGAVFTLLFPA